MANNGLETLTRKSLNNINQILDLEDEMVDANEEGNDYPNDERTFLIVENGSASDVTVTIEAQRDQVGVTSFGQLSLDDIEKIVGAGKWAILAAPPGGYNDAQGRARVTYSSHDDVKVVAVRRTAD